MARLAKRKRGPGTGSQPFRSVAIPGKSISHLGFSCGKNRPHSSTPSNSAFLRACARGSILACLDLDVIFETGQDGDFQFVDTLQWKPNASRTGMRKVRIPHGHVIPHFCPDGSRVTPTPEARRSASLIPSSPDLNERAFAGKPGDAPLRRRLPLERPRLPRLLSSGGAVSMMGGTPCGSHGC